MSLIHRPEDLAFYTKLGVPPPTLSPMERRRRRLMFRNERVLYRTTCAATGKSILSIYAPTKGATVYEFNYWHSDAWNPLIYSRDFDFSRPFFEQWKQLFDVVPKMNLVNDSFCENSEFVNQVGHCKNCYMIFRADTCENTLYSHALLNLQECLDCEFMIESELCYECTNCKKGYRLLYSEDSERCTDSAFLIDCKGCTHCLGCFGLRNQNYMIFNQAYTQQEYEEKYKQYALHTLSGRAKFIEEFENWIADRRPEVNVNSAIENSSGVYLENTTNCHMCEFVLNAENSAYISTVYNAKDSVDHDIWGNNTEMVYQCITVGENAQTIAFCFDVWHNVHDIWYSSLCTNSKHLFGCVGLKNKEYCVFNKQYSEAEYHDLVARIKQHMISTGEWGEFFPAWVSPFAYNESIAQEMFPLTKEEALQNGFTWFDDSAQATVPTAAGYTPEDDIFVYQDQGRAAGLLKEILMCEETKKPFKIMPQELAFYLKLGIPVPRLSHNARYTARRGKLRRLRYEENIDSL